MPPAQPIWKNCNRPPEEGPRAQRNPGPLSMGLLDSKRILMGYGPWGWLVASIALIIGDLA